ncbi:MAG: M28 family peptidase [Planctomycetes bacterium]|nr:M28 family peptidase [Planctomycetota bacterium]
MGCGKRGLAMWTLISDYSHRWGIDARIKWKVLRRCWFVATVGVVAGVAGLPATSASEIGQQVADEVDVASYQHYLDDELYTHDGDNRGVFGPEHNAARNNIASILGSFGLQVEVHQFSVGPYNGFNVVATQTGTAYPDAQYIVGAHYDSAENPGADDDASGVAGVLEIARVLSQYETEYTIKYMAFDFEEWGFLGSIAYVDDHMEDDIRGMIQLDMIAHQAGAYPESTIYGSSQSDPLKMALLLAILEYGNRLHADIHDTFDASDHAPFEWAGFEACLLTEADVTGNPCLHQPCDSVDTPDYIFYDLAADQVRSVAGLLADLAGVVVDKPCEGDANGDGLVDPLDSGFVLARCGCDVGSGNPDCDIADMNGDALVDPLDVGYVLARFGPC